MEKENVSETMNWWCDNCGGEGDIEYPDEKTELPALVICSHCSTPSAYVWCSKCGMGGQIADAEFINKPNNWKCKKCHSEYPLPSDFYQNPVSFQPQAFADIQKIKENRFIREYGHVNVNWIKQGLLFWKKTRSIPLVSALGIFVMAIGCIIQPSLSFLAGYAFLFSIVLIGVVLLVDIIGWLTSKLFLMMYKIRKNQG